MIKILFDSTKEEKDLDSGISSTVSWRNLKDDLAKQVKLKNSEEIIGLVIGEDGIKVSIGPK